MRLLHRAMHTVFGIRLPDGEGEGARRAAREAFALLDRLEAELSRFAPGSDLARLNALPPGGTTVLGPDAFACLALAERVRARTRGAFDACHASRRRGGRFRLHPASRTARAAGRVRADLGAVGKGHALDRMAAVLRDHGVIRALLDSGESSVLAVGGPWHVALRPPWVATQGQPRAWSRGEPGPDEAPGAVRLNNAALSGSGMALNGPHIRDPRTGRAARRGAAWAAARSAALSDALSTAFMVMPDRAVARLCARWRGISAIIAPGRRRRPALARAGGTAGVKIELAEQGGMA